MAERSIVELLIRAKGGRAVANETGMATRGVDRLERSTHAMGRTFTRTAAASTALGAALGYGLYRGARKSLEAFAETEKVGAQTRAVLKSTGGQAGVTQAQIAKYAASLSDMSGVEDEAIQSSENMLLTFRSIRGKAFLPATQAALDMSSAFTAMGKDMNVSDAALQLGKALNDPERGMSRLQRIGVTFTQGQIAQAKALQESGDRLGAQRVILRELNKEFGGSAKAAGKTTAGAMNRLAVATNNAEEAIGMGLAPAVQYAAGGLTKFVNAAEPELAQLSKGLDATFGRKDLDMAGKLAVSARQVRKAGKPYADELVQGLKDAHLDDKLEGAVEWAVPKIAHGAAMAAPRAAGAFAHAFIDADPWAKIAILGFGAYKLRGPMTSAGKLAAGWFGSGSKGGVLGGLAGGARGASIASPMYVSVVGPGGLPGSGPTTGGKGGGFLALAGKTLGGVTGYMALHDAAKQSKGLSQYSGSKGFGELGRDLTDWLHGDSSYSEKQRAAKRVLAAQGGHVGLMNRDPFNPGNGLGRLPTTRTTTIVRPRTTVVTQPVILKVDGKTLAKAQAKVTVSTRDLDRHG